MTDPEQITDNSIRQAITERLQATHVEVTDMSGKNILSQLMPFPSTLQSHAHTP
jgi:hypothetical protein